MNRNEQFDVIIQHFEGHKPPKGWITGICESDATQERGALFINERGSLKAVGRGRSIYAEDWASSVPELLSRIAEKAKQELKYNLLAVKFDDLEKRVQRLESRQSAIVPIDSFTPEPYEVLKTIRVTVNAIEGGFNAGWFDANVHFSGDNEQEAVSNLKGLILDIFETYSSEPSQNLGPEPTRQLAVMKEYIQRKL